MHTSSMKMAVLLEYDPVTLRWVERKSIFSMGFMPVLNFFANK